MSKPKPLSKGLKLSFQQKPLQQVSILHTIMPRSPTSVPASAAAAGFIIRPRISSVGQSFQPKGKTMYQIYKQKEKHKKNLRQQKNLSNTSDKIEKLIVHTHYPRTLDRSVVGSKTVFSNPVICSSLNPPEAMVTYRPLKSNDQSPTSRSRIIINQMTTLSSNQSQKAVKNPRSLQIRSLRIKTQSLITSPSRVSQQETKVQIDGSADSAINTKKIEVPDFVRPRHKRQYLKRFLKSKNEHAENRETEELDLEGVQYFSPWAEKSVEQFLDVLQASLR